jgi:hypothetical protein
MTKTRISNKGVNSKLPSRIPKIKPDKKTKSVKQNVRSIPSSPSPRLPLINPHHLIPTSMPVQVRTSSHVSHACMPMPVIISRVIVSRSLFLDREEGKPKLSDAA